MIPDREHIRSLVLEAGACAAGFAEAGAVDDEAVQLYRQWLADGRNAGMDYLERYDEVRRDPRLLIDEAPAATVISCAFAYADSSTPHHPLFADYALGADYHKVLRKALEPVASYLREAEPGSVTRICVDTAPIRERYWAAKAGIGFTGLNNQLIVPGVGAGVFLAELLWTESVEPDEPCLQACNHCGACAKACPAGALDGCGGLDARRCLSYLTIEHRGSLPAGVELPGRIYGCDICRHVCPCSSGNEDVVVLDAFRPTEALLSLDVEGILSLDETAFSALFSRSAVKRAKLEGLRRNAARRKKL